MIYLINPYKVRAGSVAAEPYALYTGLDLATIPYHATNPIVAPTLPTTGAMVTVTNDAEFDAEIDNGVWLFLDGTFTTRNINFYSDVRLTIADGATIVKNSVASVVTGGSRILIEGESEGATTGTGLLDGYVLVSGATTDLVVRGLCQKNGFLSADNVQCERAAYLNMRAKDGDIGYTFTDLVVAGCNFDTVAGGLAWVVRLANSYERIAFFESEFQNQVNATIRMAPSIAPVVPGTDIWVGDCRIKNNTEGYVFRVDLSNGLQDSPVGRVWVDGATRLWSAVNGAEANPATNQCDYFRGAATVELTTANGSYTPNTPGAGEDWETNYIVKDFGADGAPWTEWVGLNSAGDPGTIP